ncbi:hypothetical protein KR018_012009, partial [Drosophila ironensis]
NEHFCCTQSNNTMNQQRCSPQQLLATQLFYARLFQPQLTDQDLESEKSIEKAELRKSDIRQDDLPPTPSSQDNNNNNEILNDIESYLRCDDHPFSELSNFHQILSNRAQINIQKNEKNDISSQFYKDTKCYKEIDQQHILYFFREHKNILFDVKSKLEQLSLLSDDFRLSHINKNNITETALETTVRQQLISKCKMIEGILDQVKLLYHQWSSAELFYLRSLQRLGLNIEEGAKTTPTHSIMALAAIALSEESVATKSKTDKKSDCVDSKHEDRHFNFITSLGKPRTLTDIDNIMLRLASTIHKKQNCEDSCLPDSSDSVETNYKDSSVSPACIWHNKNGSVSYHKEHHNCSTAAEIILEYASLTSSSKAKPEMADSFSANIANTRESIINGNFLNRASINNCNEYTALNVMNDVGCYADKFSITPVTPPTSNNSVNSVGNVSDIFGIGQNRRKSKFARRIENASSDSSKLIMLKKKCDDVYFDSLRESPSMTPSEKKLDMSPPVPKTSSSAIAAVTAIQERAISNIYRARLSALTTVACISSDTKIGNTDSESLPMLDAPYDLSIGTKLKNMNLDTKNSSISQTNDAKEISNEKKKPHIKKPLNAFMLYMKEMRAKVVAECTLKESAAINQILGRRWHELSREEQSKYYEKARQERQLHMELYPGWSARDNYGYVSKKKKRKKDRSTTDSGGNNMKKCRARFGLDQQNQWCKPCRRKKKCIRYMEALNGNGTMEDGSGIEDHGSQQSDEDEDDDDENQLNESCGSADENNKILDDDTESLNQSLSSPGCLSSVQSPSTTSLASPLNMNINTIVPAAFSGISTDHSSAKPRISSVSISGSSSGSTCSISTTPNTSSTVSPVTGTSGPSSISAHERAMMLGNRFSHLGMGLNGPVISTSTTKPDPYFQPHPAVINNTFPVLSTISCSSLNNSCVLPKVLVPNISRNPIGANPRDINNPLSINQLTKRRENLELSEVTDSQTNVAHAATSLIHNITTHSYHSSHSHLNGNFNQQFHQQFGRSLEPPKCNESTILPVGNSNTVNNGECHKTSESQANASSSPSAGATETGAISVS